MGGAKDSRPDNNSQIRTWIADLTPDELSLWREAMTQLRQTHGDVWNGVRFFLTVNGIIIVATFAFMRNDDSPATNAMIDPLAIMGLILTAFAMFILYGHRTYYLDMLIRKTLIEDELGFYRVGSCGVDLSFPWSVPQQHLAELKANPPLWKLKRLRSGRITPLLGLTYLLVAGVHVWVLAQ